QVVSRVYKYLSVEIALNDIFKEPTIAGLAGIIQQKKMTGFIRIPNVEEQEYYDVSNAQRRLWVLNQFENTRIAYNIPLGFSLKGELNTHALHSAFRHLIRRHESLRTSITTINGLPRQVIHPAIDFYIPEEVLRPGEPGLARTAALHAKTVFDLSEAPLFNVKLVKTRRDNHILLFNIHHIISDGWSMNILTDELSVLYNAYARPGNLLPPLRTRYKDYAHWQTAYLSSPAGESQKNYWLEKLSGELPVLEFPTDYARPAAVTYNGKSIRYTIGSRLTPGINRFCKQQGVTLFMILSAAVKTLIYRYCGGEDIIVGSPAAARNHPDLEDQVGFFVNTLALRSRINENQPFEIFLQQVKQTTIEAFDNQAYPFDKLVSELNPDRDTGRHPLFDIMVVLQNNEPARLKFDKIEAEPFEIQYNTAKFDLTFIFTESAGEIIMDIDYSTDLFKAHRIRRLGTHFAQLLKSIVHDSKQTLPRLTLLTAREKHRLLVEFNGTTTGYPKEKTIAELFEDQAVKSGDRAAVVSGAQSAERKANVNTLTYRELNHRSNRFAYLLMEKGVQPDTIVAVMAEPSPEMVVGILAILKAGGAYLPIDPDYPQERINYMLADSAAELLLTARDGALTLTPTPRRGDPIIPPPDGVPLSRGDLKDWEHPGKSPLERGERAGCVESAPCPASTHPTHLSYIMYTSGSSGKPKGVMVTQRSVVRLVKNTRYIQISGRDRILATGAPSFDASTFEIWGSLLNGAELHISNPGDVLNTAMLATLIQKETITIIWLTVGLFNTIADIDAGIFQNVATLLVGGDRLSPAHIRKCMARCPSLNIINGYGPTENTTFTTTYEIPAKFKGDIPIGKPISNTRVTILDKHHQLLPIGVTGELYASGDGLARGYLNSVILTAEKFIPHPYKKGARLYKTGDLGRWRPDGNIEFLGRTDSQVKIRGYRIELGEIENQLAAHPQIQDAAVLSKQDKNSDKYLCAFIVSTEQLNVTDLRDYLSKHLPYYMIPAYFSQLEELPLTPNGKIDKKALSKPEAGCHQMEIGSNYVPPRNGTEKKLVNSW
ncbi:MAG: amino acid adenylation domain-containing protein, partial [bacterium]|nr:amino acid adenylation domain-containing protein [bacterium]